MGKSASKGNFMKNTTKSPHKKIGIPAILPRLVQGTRGTFLVYGGFKSGIMIPATQEQAERHLKCLTQHMQEVSRG